MGPIGIVLLVLIAGIAVYLLITEKPFQKKPSSGDNPFDGMAKISVQLVKAPQELTERLTPKWQAELTQKLVEEGYLWLGDYSYAASLFFWARTFLAPDAKSTLILANWVSGEGGRQGGHQQPWKSTSLHRNSSLPPAPRTGPPSS